jgi:hypothetical protein
MFSHLHQSPEKSPNKSNERTPNQLQNAKAGQSHYENLKSWSHQSSRVLPT